jgi:hypothetical protein
MAFNPENSRFVISSGRQATLWDLESGKHLSTWTLPPGLVDCLAFPAEDRLLLFRVETKGGLLGPYSNVSPREHPRVCRIRNLLSDDESVEITSFAWYVVGAAMSPTGEYVVVDGFLEQGRRAVKVFDASGTEIRDIPTTRKEPSNSYLIDPSGRFLGICLDEEPRVHLVDLSQPSSTKRTISPRPYCLGPGARRWVLPTERKHHEQGISKSAHGIVIGADDRDSPLVILGIDQRIGHATVRIDPTGRYVAWGDRQGTLYVCDLPEVNRRLTTAQLGW